MASSSVVVKVKYEDTLRRFNVPVNGDKRFDLNMEGLRLKICSLFNLPSSADFSLTYEDEDDDLVTLVDDEDLHDVVKQGLNPVRITVCLKKDQTAQPRATFSGSSKPRGSSLSSMQQNVNSNVAEVLKSVPEPLRDAFAKISTELTSNVASASPILADLLDGFSKIGQPYLNVSSECGTTSVNNHAEGCDNPKQNTPTGKVDASIGKVVKHNDTQTSNFVQQQFPESPQATREADPTRHFPSTLCSLKGKNAILEPTCHKLSASEVTKEDKELFENVGKSGGGMHPINYPKGCVKTLVSSEKETSQPHLGGTRSSHFGGSSFKPYFDASLIGSSPFSGLDLPNAHMPEKLYDHINESYKKVDTMGSIFHKGVRCDGCGVLPITGPRFKSKVKYDYDLCSICFGRMGNDLDYSRINFPLSFRRPYAFKGFYDPDFKAVKALRVPPVRVPWATRRPTGKHPRSRLDSRFIMDVNVLDGTIMAPLTPFTKIWRMRNNGTLPWYRGLQLVWIGGDRFSASDSVNIEIPREGVHVCKEIDIAVDFVAPELPGRYISYWRMAEQSGHKFGQRVWVLIQVDASMNLTQESSPGLDLTQKSSPGLDLTQESSPGLDLTHESAFGLNLNLPPDTNEALETQVLDVNIEPALNFEKDPRSSRLTIEMEDLNFRINKDLLGTSGVFYPTSAAASSSTEPAVGANDGVFFEASPVSNPDVADNGNHKSTSAPPTALYPIINMSEGSSTSSIAKNEETNLEQYHETNNVEETLLKELEQMGFKQVSLNKEVLRANEYDLEQSVDDLCGVSEWDPMLEELKEMGFEDNETNRKLLAKNNGSITRVVMDLIAGETLEEA